MKGIKIVEQALDIFGYIVNDKSNLIRYNSVITLKHNPTGRYLSNYVVNVVRYLFILFIYLFITILTIL